METNAGFSRMQTSFYPERRSGKDRRAKPTSPFTWSSLRGSRRNARRAEDRDRHRFVDVYSPTFLLVIVVILSLCVLDALFTLELIRRGAQELNPVMAFFLQFGHLPFLIVKYLLTASGLMTLLILKNCTVWGGRISVKVVLLTFPFLYLILIGYEVFLLAAIPA